MRKILMIQSRECTNSMEAEQNSYRKLLDGLAELTFESALDISHSWDSPENIIAGFDAVILGGSGDYDLDGGRPEDDPARKRGREIAGRVRAFVEYLRTTEVPFFGVCFGHQLIAEAHGGKVSHDHRQKKTGTYEVHLTEQGSADDIFGSLPTEFLAQYAHKDSVTRLPRDATPLAGSSVCRFSALRYGRWQYTTQFHPELTAEDAIKRFSSVDGYLPKGIDAQSVVRESPEASTLIPLWIEKIS